MPYALMPYALMPYALMPYALMPYALMPYALMPYALLYCTLKPPDFQGYSFFFKQSFLHNNRPLILVVLAIFRIFLSFPLITFCLIAP